MATTKFPVRVAEIVRWEAGEPVRKVVVPQDHWTATDVAYAVARGASVVCLVCEDAWDWCPHLGPAVEARLPRARAAVEAAFARSGAPLPPVFRTRPEEPVYGVRHEDGLVVLTG